LQTNPQNRKTNPKGLPQKCGSPDAFGEDGKPIEKRKRRKNLKKARSLLIS
jgi:hypothetical protein